MKSRLLPTLFALALLVFAGSAAATSFVMVADETLVDQAALVVDARVLSSDSAPWDGLPSTDYMIEVDRALAGEPAGRNLIVRVPGGVGNGGHGLALYGMPAFGVGERVVLFLKPRADGTYGVLHLMLGAFHEVVIDGQAVLLRDLSGARELGMPGEPEGSRDVYNLPRAAEPFRRWIEDRAHGEQREADYRLPASVEASAGGLGNVTGQYVLFQSDRTGLNLRWFAFDEGQNVDWFIQGGGQPGYGQSLTAQIAQAAMNGWNAISQTNIRYRYAGTTGDTSGFDGCGQSDCSDGLSTILFGNADGSHDEDFRCPGGGVLAIGGPWFNSRISENGPHGARFHRIPEAEIITNRNIECFLTSFNDLLQLLAHELGHTLGINHTCDPDGAGCTALQADALMYPFFHEDERGAQFNSDDRSAARYLYPGSTGSAPAAPSGLAATVLSSSEVELAWDDNSNDETFFRIEARPAGVGSFVNVGTASANQETFVVDGLAPDTAYDFRVQARNGAVGSPFSNTVTVTTLADVPAAPSSLTAAATTEETVFLQWQDLADNEDSYVVEMRRPSTADWEVVEDAISADSTSFFVGGLVTGEPYAFRVLAVNDNGPSLPSEEVAVTPLPAGPSSCEEDGETLCLGGGGRFEVYVHWRNQFAVDDFGHGNAETFAGSDRTGRFTFFNPNNVELIVKVLDGSNINDFYWTFYGALSNVEYWITVIDTDTGASRTYYNPPGGDCGQFDTQSIAETSQAAPLRVLPLRVDAPVKPAATAPLTAVTAAQGTCEAGDETLCLFDDRFAVEVDWTNQHAGGEQGVGHAIPDDGGDRTGYFWFFNPANVELVTKVLYAPATDTYWFFYGSLSNVQYTITVTDTESGEEKSYTNPPGGECGQFDTAAFPPLDDEQPDDPVTGSPSN